MMSMKHSALAMLLAVYRCFSSPPLSLVQRHIEGIYYFGTAVSPEMIPWCSSQTSKVQFGMVNRNGPVRFTAAVKETINCLNWFQDNLKSNSPVYPYNSREFFGDKTSSLGIVNNGRTLEMSKRSFLVTI